MPPSALFRAVEATALPSNPPLDSGPGFQDKFPLNSSTMGQQTNKHIKKKRRLAYHKRRNAALKAKIAKAKK